MLTGDESKKFTDELFKRHKKERAEKLRQAKIKASEIDKEAFDINKLHQYRKPRVFDEMTDEILKIYEKELEDRYYCSNPDIMTLKEFGEYLKEIDRWVDD